MTVCVRSFWYLAKYSYRNSSALLSRTSEKKTTKKLKHNCIGFARAFAVVIRCQAHTQRARALKDAMTKKTTTNDNNNGTPNKEIRPETTTITKNPSKIVTKSQTKIHSRNNFDTNFGIFILFVRSFSQKSSLSGMYTTGIRFLLP